MRIGYISNSYLEKRCIIDAIGDYEYINIARNAQINLPLDRNEFIDKSFRYVHNVAKHNSLDIVHFVNSINLGNMPYVTSFETFVPRYFGTNDHDLQILYKHLSSPKCKALIAFSADCHAIQMNRMANNIDAQIRDNILSKLYQFNLPQKLLCPKHNINKTRVDFLFIGRDFFRKGGKELLMACQAARETLKNFHLHIAGRIQYNPIFNVTNTTEEEVNVVNDFIKSSEWITFYGDLPNSVVISLMEKCDVGFLPTFQETYGFSVLEMQASSIPVVTTDIRALNEINNEECGYIIHLPGRKEMSHLPDKTALARNSTIITNSLIGIINSILTNASDYKRKGELARERIERYHNPDQYAKQLYQIYESTPVKDSIKQYYISINRIAKSSIDCTMLDIKHRMLQLALDAKNILELLLFNNDIKNIICFSSKLQHISYVQSAHVKTHKLYFIDINIDCNNNPVGSIFARNENVFICKNYDHILNALEIIGDNIDLCIFDVVNMQYNPLFLYLSLYKRLQSKSFLLFNTVIDTLKHKCFVKNSAALIALFSILCTQQNSTITSQNGDSSCLIVHKDEFINFNNLFWLLRLTSMEAWQSASDSFRAFIQLNYSSGFPIVAA